ncbi:immunity 52 family protein [Burkholderia oklahomensis]|nr:immunity 52 family protein [Burkholderia oklahomensis]AOI42916.1 LysR family transcriptional regulator [Burkholderia oklahomensis EO147]KUY62991.1 LysR family transcriptional regulator [Burkholderia oklahomensis EO147]QPS37661.1 immunity 52 family protein [Burkholderia oklahomensis]
MEINTMFRDTTLSSRDYEEMLARESRLVDLLSTKSPTMARANWCLTGDTLEEASSYPAFESDGAPSTPALAVLTERGRGNKHGVSHAAIWNVATSAEEGASISCHVSDAKVVPDTLSVSLRVPACYATADDFADVIKAIVAAFNPLVVEASPQGYFDKQVFDDKPGVGWMLYLPKVITQQQVPEARALIPVPAKGKQTGTIIVSVTDAPFSVDNPEHVATANRIEIRLVDQDLLPAYVDI